MPHSWKNSGVDHYRFISILIILPLVERRNVAYGLKEAAYEEDTPHVNTTCHLARQKC